jgi:hypothetical protein
MLSMTLLDSQRRFSNRDQVHSRRLVLTTLEPSSSNPLASVSAPRAENLIPGVDSATLQQVAWWVRQVP